MARRMDLLNKITKQLAVLAYEVELMNRSNRMTLNSDAETIFCGLINRLEDWNLRNLNEISQNYPGIDLADPEGRIAVQITASASQKKVDHTLEVFFKNKMERDFDRLILVIITDRTAPTAAHGVKQGFKFDPKRDIWNIEWFKRRVESIEDCELLQTVADYLDSQLGELPGTTTLPMYLLPAVPAIGEDFLPGSRDEELAAMEKDLNAGKPVFIWGLGGMGKTQTAIALASRCAGEKGAYFLRYTLPTDPDREAMMETILQADFCGLNDGEADAAQVFSKRLDLLRREYSGAVLVIDGFDAPGRGMEQLKAEKSFQAVLALCNAGVSLIFTTRYPVGESAWEVKPLAEERLVELMRRCGADCEEEKLRKLIRAVDGHTLMAELMAKTLVESWDTVTAEQILEALQHNTLADADFPEVSSSQDGTYAQAKIYKHLQTLFDLAGLTEEAKHVLRCAALLPAEGMGDQLFLGCLNAAEQKELKNLVKRGWLCRGDRKISMHPVVCQVCAGLPGQEEDPFLEALWQRYEDARFDDEILRQMAFTFLNASPRLREPGAAMDCLHQALAAWRELVPTADRDLAVYDDWADPFRRVAGAAQAVQFKKSSLSVKMQFLPENDPGMAAALGNLGVAWRSAADYEKALEYSRKSLAVWEKLFAAPSPALARAYSDHARTCYEMGDLPQALKYLEKSLLIWMQVVKPGHPNITAVERNIAFVKAEME